MNNKLNYPNWLVPLDIAQELKAIGFDVPCLFHFLYYHGWEMLKKRGDEYGFITSNSCRAYVEENHNGIGNLSAPTWEQVFEWFREKGFNAWIEYQTLYENYIPKLAVREEFIYIKNNKGYKTYEKAREALVVTLIQTYKSKQL